MKLVILNAGADTAGCGIGLKRAFDKYADGWEARAICRSVPYFEYPTDIVWPLRTPVPSEVAALVREADVIHVMDHEYALGNFTRRDIRGKVIVVHHLGTNYRRAPEKVSAYCRAFGAIQVTDSIDLMGPEVSWLPVTTDLDAIARVGRDAYRPSTAIRIAHAPTNREIKSTDLIIETLERLQAAYPIEFDIIEGVTNAECLQRKARADIFVDQLRLGFGLNFIECAAMGIAVVSGWEQDEWRQRSLDLWGALPWADATPETLYDVLRRLVVDREWRDTIAAQGQFHVMKWHSEQAVVRQTLAVYERALVPA